MLKRLFAWLLFAAVLACAPAVLAQPKVPPVPTVNIYAQDYAQILSRETISRINSMSSDLRSATRAQVVVVTVPNLGGESIEDFSLALFRKWGIGDRQLNNGVLLLFSLEEKKSRIEVGYGLEGALPDAKAGRILDERLIPALATGDYNTGIMNAYLGIMEAVSQEYSTQLNSKQRVSPRKRTSSGFDIWDAAPLWVKILVIAIGFILLLIDWFVLGGFFTRTLFMFGGFGGGGGGGGFGGGSGGGGGSSR